jgi:hypothetical protein
MNLLEALAGIFINTFGITQPTDRTRRMAAWFILGMLVAVAMVLTLGGITLWRILRA